MKIKHTNILIHIYSEYEFTKYWYLLSAILDLLVAEKT